MGQQQLLLLVLGIVIVGIAVVAGIQAFSEGKTKATSDAAVSDAMRIITDLQAWYLKPEAFGGGGEDTTNWVNVKYSSIGLDTAADADGTSTDYETVNGCFKLGTGTNKGIPVEIFTRSGGNCATAKFATATIKNASPTSGVSWVYE